ncbi:MAG: leucine--tRNA ligase [Candidatus Dadabacteria bacterium]|nr:MAG: leucine--tRNA ligase [Candidatus Dadabacteria bacterium]
MTIEPYDPQRVEEKWQARWEKQPTRRESGGTPFYLLEMFPYPSGRIHMGHVRNYTIGDVLARFLTARGYSVLHPMGWDAFGLPAEQAAIKHGVAPAKWTADNIATMRAQLKRMGFRYDWDLELATCDPSYYRWEQLFFIQMLERGLAYRKSAKVNWCDECGTVLANEQVDGDECWRGHRPVRRKELDQWFLRITAYAEELLEGLDQLTGWPEKVITMQRNWIGRSEGVEIDFELVELQRPLKVFTTRADTLFGATFVSVAVEHPEVEALARAGGRAEQVMAFAERVASQDPQERAEGKEGIFTGCHAVNPINGRKVPVYLANFVLMEYGTGAVMAVPAHDQRDFEFATRYGIPVEVVVEPVDGRLSEPLSAAFEADGVLRNSGPFDGLTSAEARRAIAEELERRGRGRRTVHYRLRDWGISRQRYWGAPIPVVYCDDCGIVPVPAEQLPVKLPLDVTLLEGGGSPLPVLESFVSTTCPRCGRRARRETDTMDTFVESSWYFLRFPCARLDSAPFDPQAIKRWLPVDQYIGGIEHAVLHLLYARFFTRVLRDLGWIELSEPFERLLTQGMVIKDGAKMSKSRGNVVDPDELVQRYGADTARLFSMFAAPPEKDLEWSDRGVEGAARFLARLWRLVGQAGRLEIADPGPEGLDDAGAALRRRAHETIARVTRDIGERMRFNTGVAAIMELVNHIAEYREKTREPDTRVLGFALSTTLRLLFPYVPHVTSELWERAVGSPPLEEMPWPEYDERALARETVELPVQVNGKVRSRITVPADLDRDAIAALALADEKILRALGGKKPRRTVVVPGRVVNIVV